MMLKYSIIDAVLLLYFFEGTTSLQELLVGSQAGGEAIVRKFYNVAYQICNIFVTI